MKQSVKSNLPPADVTRRKNLLIGSKHRLDHRKLEMSVLSAGICLPIKLNPILHFMDRFLAGKNN